MQRRATNVHWIVERRHPAAGWVVLADSDTHNSVRSLDLAEHKALIWQFVDESLSWLLPRANWRRYTWPTTITPWSAQRERRIRLHEPASLDPNSWDEIPFWKEARARNPNLSDQGANGIGRCGLGDGFPSSVRTWPRPDRLARFLARTQAFTLALPGPPVWRTPGGHLAASAHARLDAARINATFPPLNPAHVRLLARVDGHDVETFFQRPQDRRPQKASP